MFFLAFDDGLVPVGAGSVPVAGGVLAVGLCGMTVAPGGHAVLASGIPVIRGSVPGCAGQRQYLLDGLAIFPVRGLVRPGQFLIELPLLPVSRLAGGRQHGGVLGSSLLAQSGGPQPVAYPLIAGCGLLIGGCGLAVAFGGLVITFSGAGVTLHSLGIAVVGGAVPGIAGLPPARLVAGPQPGVPPLPGGHPPP